MASKRKPTRRTSSSQPDWKARRDQVASAIKTLSEHGDFVFNDRPVAFAFDVLTETTVSEPTPRPWRRLGTVGYAHERRGLAQAVFRAAVEAVIDPRGPHDRWLQKAFAALPKQSKDTKCAEAVRALRDYESEFRSNPDGDETRANLRARLSWLDPNFRNLRDGALRAALSHLKPNRRKTGATHMGVYSVLAELCVRAGALGYAQKPSEELVTAIDRTTKALRAAATRAEK